MKLKLPAFGYLTVQHGCLFLLFVVLSGCSIVSKLPELTKEEIQNEKEYQRTHLVRRLADGTQTLADAAWPILINNIDLCDGFTDYRIGLWLARESTDEVGKEADVWGVAVNSPAARAGVQSGDRIVQIDGHTITSSGTARSMLYSSLKMFRTQDRSEPVRIKVQRDSSSLVFSIQPVLACRSTIDLRVGLAFNAFATGNRIEFLTGTLAFLDSQTEVQYILAHELAHNLANHVSKARFRAAFGTVFDLITLQQGVWSNGLFTQLGLISYSKRFENEADYLSLYLLANADIPIDGVEDLWRRLSTDGGLGYSLTHPSKPVRYLRMRKTVEEINAKRAKGMPLVPETKRNAQRNDDS